MPSVTDADHQHWTGHPDRPERTVALPGTEHEHRRDPVGYDTELQLHHEVLRHAWGVEPDDQVLDVGCGTGQTTREAAHQAASGSALGVDISKSAIERARELALAQGLDNVAFECADAQVRRFPQERFDLAISRFGTMFFDDRVAAFANIRRALRPAGRLVMMVWQAHDSNEWDIVIHQALATPEATADVASQIPGPFSLADPPSVDAILLTAGFAGVTFIDVDQPVYYGPDVATALNWVRSFTCTDQILKQLSPTAATQALHRLRDALAAHMRADGVWFNSRAWIVTARRHP
jgi:SAM-dependent methyltransferase